MIHLWSLNNNTTNNNGEPKSIEICQSFVDVHHEPITSVRLSMNMEITGRQQSIEKTLLPSSIYELLVGDLQGNVSRYNSSSIIEMVSVEK